MSSPPVMHHGMGAGSIVRADVPTCSLARFQSNVRDRPVVSVLACLTLISLFFVLAPGIDLAFSRLFYQPAKGFIGRQSSTVEFVRDLGLVLEWALAIGVSLSILTKVLSPQSRLFVQPRSMVFVLATFALGPGLIVNGVLKTYWGRARPREILEFGGGSTFSPAWLASDQCAGNCSFVSGEAASAFFLVAVVFLVNRNWRPAAALLASAIAGMISLARIAGGAHFLSDVLIAWILMLLVIAALHHLVLRGFPSTFDEKVEVGLVRGGEALRTLLRGRVRLPSPQRAK
jgi:lipid A 4'-phosphatase